MCSGDAAFAPTSQAGRAINDGAPCGPCHLQSFVYERRNKRLQAATRNHRKARKCARLAHPRCDASRGCGGSRGGARHGVEVDGVGRVLPGRVESSASGNLGYVTRSPAKHGSACARRSRHELRHGKNRGRVALEIVRIVGLDRSGPKDSSLETYGVGSTDANAIIDGIARARRPDPLDEMVNGEPVTQRERERAAVLRPKPGSAR
jgi:hypothetical protein